MVIVYPKTEFAGHVVPKDGTGATLATNIQEFTETRGVSWESIGYLVSDGCEKMVGWRTGVHATFEKIHKKVFGRIICIFHHSEKSFSTVFLLYSGHTTGPRSYSGDLGKDIKGEIHTLPLADFEVLANPSLLALLNLISEETLRSLSNDHQIFIGLIKIAITGEINLRWVSMRIGPMVTSRFTTTQARVVRKWLSTPNPSFEMSRVMRYLGYVWAEVFLVSKHKNQFLEAPRALLL